MADQEPRPITDAPSERARQRLEDAAQRAEDRHQEERAAKVADHLKATGAVVIPAADDAERKQARKVARRAGGIIGRRVRTTTVEGGIGVWDDDRGNHPLQAQADEARTNRLIEQQGPLFPWLNGDDTTQG
ncbi:hypothetical protein ACFOVU_01460 [Nocardiopsis sediminis]|uniref:Uncharacterized protein n=1 Tax=Nocardiopsis sediminis TaxID=1778267 RepID=A0ABV8FEL0_9ACTN